MSRINTNVQSLIAQRVLSANNYGLGTSLQRLSTGLKINRGKDDPAGLIASENLRSNIRGINTAISNAERADQVTNIAEGGLSEISSLLTELQGLLTASANKAGLSESERNANQLQIDSILQSIDRVASASSFQGTKLLNGNFDYQVEGVAAGVTDYRINAAKLESSSLDVSVLVTNSAQQGGLYLSFNGSQIDLGTGSAFTIEIAGRLGSRELTFTSGNTLAQIVEAVNTFQEVTGVRASAGSTGLHFLTNEYGSKEFVSVRVVDSGSIGTGNNIGVYAYQPDSFGTVSAQVLSTFAAASNPVRDFGQDLGATINGITAVANGRTARINTDFLDVEITLDSNTAQQLGQVGTSSAFTITGGGADFQLSSDVNIAGRVSIGIAEVSARRLGNSTLGFLKDLSSGRPYNVVDGNKLSTAQKIVDEAIGQVSSMRGRLGAFQRNTIGATIRSLGIASENVQAAESIIRDADFATETAALTRSQILVAASTNVLALANANPQSVLQLLG